MHCQATYIHEDDSLGRFQNVYRTHRIVSRNVCVHMKPLRTQQNHCSIYARPVSAAVKLPQSTKKRKKRAMCFYFAFFLVHLLLAVVV